MQSNIKFRYDLSNFEMTKTIKPNKASHEFQGDKRYLATLDRPFIPFENDSIDP